MFIVDRLYKLVWNANTVPQQPVSNKTAALTAELFSKIQEDFRNNQSEQFNKDMKEAVRACKFQLINSNLSKEELVSLGQKINDLCGMIYSFQSRPLEGNSVAEMENLLDDFSFYHKLCATRIRTGSDRSSEVNQRLKKLEDDLNNLSLATVPLLLQEMDKLDIDIDTPLPNSGLSALSLSIKNRNLAVVQLLLNQGANPNQKTNDNKPIAVQAAQLDNMEILAALIKHGADLNVALESEQNILQSIANKKGLNSAIHLIKLGANPALLSNELKLQVLNLAIEQADLEITKKLIDAGAPVNEIPKGSSLPPLIHAMELGREEIAIQLIESGADLYFPFNINNDSSKPSSPLNFAVEKRLLQVVSTLVSKGVSPSSDPFKKSPFFISIDCGDIELIKVFLDKSIDLPAEKIGLAIHKSINMQNLPMIDLLLDKAEGMVVSVGNTGLFRSVKEFPDPGLYTPLQAAVIVGNESIIQMLLNKGVEINGLGGSDPNGAALLETPLLTAIAFGKIEIAHFLLDKGADFNQPDALGNTPFSLASIRMNNKELRDKLSGLAQRLFSLNAVAGKRMPNAIALNMMTLTESAIQSVSMFTPQSMIYQIAEEQIQLIALAEVFSVYREKSAIQYGANYQEEISLHGGFADRYWMKMQNSLSEYSSVNVNEYNQKHCTQLQKACYNIALHFSEGMPEEAVRLYNNGELVLLNTGFRGHHTSIMLWDGKLILCNRGAGKGATSYTVYDVPTGMINLSFINKMRSLSHGAMEEYVNFFSENNLRSMGFKQSSTCRMLENLPMPKQLVGNCTWANSSAQVFPFFVLSQIKDHRLTHLGQEPSETEIKQFIAKAHSSYSRWESIHKAQVLEDYMSKEVMTDQGGIIPDSKLVMEAIVTHFYYGPVVDDPYVQNKWEMVFNQIVAWVPEDKKHKALQINNLCKTEYERRKAAQLSSA